MLTLLLVHAVAAVFAVPLVRLLDRRAFSVLALAPAATTVWAAFQGPAVLRGDGPQVVVNWVPSLHVELAFRLDPLSWVLTLLVGGVGALVLFYCGSYFHENDPGSARFAAVLTAFTGAMTGLVLADDLVQLYVFWELTTVFSYLLIGYDAHKRSARRAATQALVVTTFGGLAMLVGLIVIGQSAGTYRLSEVLEDFPTGTATTVAVVLVLVGAISKSALVPFHFWLPAAMAAPTPVSAYLHAAAMVKAGIYLIARFAPAAAELPAWRTTVLVLGLATMVIGGYRSLRQHDVKLLLAFGTVSQLGFLTVLVGAGTAAATTAGIALLVAHATFKAALFLVVGIVDHQTHTRDLRELSGLGRRMPLLAVVGTVAAASMAGVPIASGFVAKEAAYAAFEEDPVVLGVLVLGSVLTAAYSARFVWGTFCRKPGVPDSTAPKPSAALIAAPLVLAAVTLLTGPLAPLVDKPAALIAHELPGEAEHLALWHGVGLPLVLTVITFLLAGLLFLARDQVELLQSKAPDVPAADRGYRKTVRAVDRVAVEVTGATQRGSLPIYLASILLVVVLVPGGALLWTQPWPSDVVLYDNLGQVVVGVVMVVAAVLTVRARRRLRAVMLVGVTGYGVTLLFVLHAGPDLALTQALAETITLVVFVLALRRLPPFFSSRPLVGTRWVRIAIGIAVGTCTSLFALVASGARVAVPTSIDLPQWAYDYGGGKNVVNVTLVDVRAWDTMGEISVLLVAATGVASLVFRRRMGSIDQAFAAHDEENTPKKPTAWLPAGGTVDPERRSVVFEVVTRLTFHAIVVLSVYLVFSGHNQPGGGFAGGLVAGLALVVRYLAGGRYEFNTAVPINAGWLLGSGLFLSAGTGLVGILLGGDVLQTEILQYDLPVLGHVKLVTSLFFDVGVYLLVVGLVVDVIRSLGAEIDRQIEETSS
ncbi:Na+/H+ antiporter subunit A [Kineococcus rhizosphaerae]|uniref:Multisubunit sodium/proton antiporter MrpA subunit /multisubunit sodium/proton antiporter MrpB subunit n=1 Tax=Kineococcus rhizosphaerae TaxID=559628 RepID=A0A2T0QYE7_9ACTN|nr:Na+/H+ antiporter subunit A [Kineococcus rhizosphaerae]PRY11389.1 multisubunit sodium/proton antiporter MrpA subunit /multisubunit sodium/proton antiporter MrpB subunit [Kineococcus rhizosphaerae]